ncbi:MAG: DUF2007 domain-containing protein [Nitrospirota bacterium]|jgi:hypothetical protein
MAGGKPLAQRIRESIERFRELLGSEEPFEEVLVTYDPVEAEMVKDVLESGGIEVVLRSAKVSPFPVNVGKTGEIKVLVPRAEAETARAVIDSFRAGAP